MSFYERVSQYHSENRFTFVLLTETIAFVGTLTTMMTIAFVRELLS
jgi:hypothetical protein